MREDLSEFAQFRALVINNAELIALIWRIGDGDGGWAIQEIKRLLNIPELSRAKEKKKAKIDGMIRKAVMERDKYRCVSCATHLDLCLDHKIPESKGGKASIENLQTLCRSCNSAKGVK